ncbi:glucoamylase family protein [Methylocaldum sp. MU1018]
MNPIKRLFLMVGLGVMAFSAGGSDLAVTDEPVLKELRLADFDGKTDEAALSGDWKILAERQPAGVAFRLDEDRANAASGRSLHVSYALPLPTDSVDLPETGGEFGASLDLKGLDAADYDHLSFWVKGDPAEGFNPEFEVQFRRPDSAGNGMKEVGSFMVSGITDRWKRVIIPLNYMIGIKDWRQLSAFVISLPPREMRVRKGAYWVDDIALIKTGKPGPGTGDPVVAEKKKAWEDALGGEAAARSKLRERLAGWPAAALIDGKTLPADEREFLYRIASDTWRGLDALTDKLHGLPLDRVHFGNGSVNLSDSKIGDYTSVTNIGFHFLAVTAAHELGFITREQALERLSATLATLEALETYRGFYFNYYNTTTLERTSHFISFVDSSWLTAGLMVARQAFPELADRCTRLIDREDYRFFYDPGHKLMSHGYYVNMALRSTFHYGVFYAESRIGSLIAIGKGDVPEEHWFRMARTLSAEFEWQSLPPLARNEKSANGFRWIGGYYQWRDYRYVPSWGGSLFEALMPSLVLDEAQYAPASLGYNGKVHADIHRVYALESLGYPVWGMSPSSTPGADRYSEYGVKVLGTAGYADGAVTPHAAALALLAEPSGAAANLRKLAELYPVYGDFGFYDAVNPVTGEVAYNYLCLNQAMILVALANHLADHAVQKRFAADPIVQRALPLIGFEKFVDQAP